MNEIKEYKAVNLKSPIIIFFMITFLCVSVFLLRLSILSNILWWSILLGTASLIFQYFLYYSLTTKILLTKTTIIKKTPLGSTELKYRDIKSFGVYSQGRYSAYKLNEIQIQEKDYFGQKFVYVANRPNYDLNSFNQKGSIRFHLTDDIYELLKQKKEEKSNYLKF
jgi:hypothetical protein